MNPADNDDGRKRKPDQDESFAGMKNYMPQGTYDMYEGRNMPTTDLMYTQKSVSNADFLTGGAEEESFGSKKRKMNIPKQAIQVPAFGAAVSQRTDEVAVKSNTSWFESNQNVFRKSTDVSVDSQVHPSISLQRQGHSASEVQQSNMSNQRQVYQSSTVVQQFDRQQQSSDISAAKQFQSNINMQNQTYSSATLQHQQIQQQQQQQLLQQQKQQQIQEQQQKQQLQQRQQQQQQLLQQQKMHQEQQLKQQQLQEEKLRQEREQEQQLQQQRLQQQQMQQQQLQQQREQQQKQLQEEKLRQEREREQQLQQQRIQQQQLQQQQLQQQQLQQQQQQQQKQLQEEKLRKEREQEQLLQQQRLQQQQLQEQQLQQQREEEQKQLQEEKLRQEREKEQQLQQQRLQQQQLQRQQEQQQKELEKERLRQEQEREQQLQQQRLQQQQLQQQQLQQQQEEQRKQQQEEKLRQEREQEQKLQQQRLQQQQEEEQRQQLLQQQAQERQRQQQEQQQQEQQQQLFQQQQQQEEERKQQLLQEEKQRQEQEEEQQLQKQRLQLLQQQHQKQQHVHVSSTTTQSTISSALKSGFNIAASLNPSLGEKVCTKESKDSGADHSIASALKGTFAAAAAPIPEVYSETNIDQKPTETATKEADSGSFGLLSAMKNVYDAVTGTTTPQPVVSAGSSIGAALKGMGNIGTAMIVPPSEQRQPTLAAAVSKTPVAGADVGPARQVPMTHTASLIANIVNPMKGNIPVAIPVTHQPEPVPAPEAPEKDVIDFTIQGSEEEDSGSDALARLVESGNENLDTAVESGSDTLESGTDIIEIPIETPVDSGAEDTDAPGQSIDTPMETPVDSPIDSDKEVSMDTAVEESEEISDTKSKKIAPEVVFMDEGEDANEPLKSASTRKRKKKARKDAEERPKIYNARTRKRDCVKLHEIFMQNIDFIMSPPPPPKKTPVKSVKTPSKVIEAADSAARGKLKYTAIQSPSKKVSITPKPSTTPVVKLQKNELKRKSSSVKVPSTTPVKKKALKSNIAQPIEKAPAKSKAAKTQLLKAKPVKKAKLSKEKSLTKATSSATKIPNKGNKATQKVTKTTTTAAKTVAKKKLEAAKKIALKKRAGTRQYHQYEDKDRVKIGKYASEHGTKNAFDKFIKSYPELVSATVYSFKMKYENNQLSVGPVGKTIKTKKPVLTGASKIMQAKKRKKTVKLVVVKKKEDQKTKLPKGKSNQLKKKAVIKPANLKVAVRKVPSLKKEVIKKVVPKSKGKKGPTGPAVDSSHRIRRRYTGQERYRIGKYAYEHGLKKCALKFMQPGDLRISSIRDFRTLYERELKLAAKEKRAPSKSLMGMEKKGHPRVSLPTPGVSKVAKIKKKEKTRKESTKQKSVQKSKKVVKQVTTKDKKTTAKKVVAKDKKPTVKKEAIKDKKRTVKKEAIKDKKSSVKKEAINDKKTVKGKSTPRKLTLKVVPKKNDNQKVTLTKAADAKRPKTSKPLKPAAPKKSKGGSTKVTSKANKKPVLKKTILKKTIGPKLGKGKYKPKYSWLSRFKDFYLVDSDRPSSSGGSETSSDGVPAAAEPKRFTHAQIVELERVFTTQKYITTDESKKIAKKLKVGSDQVTKWFNNRRKKWKKVMSELETEVKQKEELPQ